MSSSRQIDRRLSLSAMRSQIFSAIA